MNNTTSHEEHVADPFLYTDDYIARLPQPIRDGRALAHLRLLMPLDSRAIIHMYKEYGREYIDDEGVMHDQGAFIEVDSADGRPLAAEGGETIEAAAARCVQALE